MYEFYIHEHKYNHIHFIGIGGISMSGLAEILLIKGYKVTGSDNKGSKIIERLQNLGGEIYIGHSKENVNGADLVIFTDAISSDNMELIAAYNSDADVVDRATFLGALMKNYTNSIAVSGTHGKTTTTSMITTITTHGNLNPTVLIGGELDDIGGNVRLGSNEYILTEACEYKANILKYFPTMAIILNMDEDHLDYFKSMDHIIDTFVGYGKNLEETNYIVINADDSNANTVIENTKANVVTFGINNDCDFKAENITYSKDGYPSYTLNIRNTEYHKINLSVMGKHNILNSLGAIAATYTLGIPMSVISEFITCYSGIHRRLELLGSIGNVKVIDDYAHHPTEIRATLSALREATKGKIYCIFQPHTFTRTKILLNKFAQAFTDADKIIIADIYAARELDKGEIHSRDLAKRISEFGKDSLYLGSFQEIEDYITKQVENEDVILTMGAGNIYKIGESILAHHKKKEAV